MELLQDTLKRNAPKMARDLTDRGYFTMLNVLPKEIIAAMRDQSVDLRKRGRFEPSWSERIVDGKAVRFDKEGVYACEPDGKDYDAAPDLIAYMSVLLQTLPDALNGEALTSDVDLSSAAFNAKLAVTSPGGSVYPLHIDNPQGLAAGDTRKLTCIVYLNPRYREGRDGGELRMILGDVGDDDNGAVVDLPPQGGRLLMFWSDEIPHEVLPSAPAARREDEQLDRYALTVWIPTENVTAIHNESSKFCALKDTILFT